MDSRNEKPSSNKPLFTFSKKDLEQLKKSASPMSHRKPIHIDEEHDIVYFSTEEDKNNPQPDFVEGWEGSLPSKLFPKNQKNYKLLDEKPNTKYHNHGPRDKCDTSCRFFNSKPSTPPSRHSMVTRSQEKNAIK